MRPGWYADPAGGGDRRWWDGEAWTEWVTTDRNAPAPPAGSPARRVVPRPRLGRQVAWGVASGLAVVVLVVGLWGRALNGPQPRPSLPPVGPASTATPLVVEGTRGTFDDGVVEWSCALKPLVGADTTARSVGVYRDYMGCAARGMEDRPAPTASLVTLGLVDDGAIVPGDLRRSATAVALELAGRAARVGRGGDAELEAPTTADDTVAGHPAGRAAVGVVVREGDRVWRDRATTWVFEVEGRTYALVRIDAEGEDPAATAAIDRAVTAVRIR